MDARLRWERVHNERSVIFNEELADWRERVTTDEERVLQGGGVEQRSDC